jgi:hypothetical protein
VSSYLAPCAFEASLKSTGAAQKMQATECLEEAHRDAQSYSNTKVTSLLAPHPGLANLLPKLALNHDLPNLLE